MRILLLGFLLLLAAGCRDDRPPRPSPVEEQQLNEADEMLNDLANEEGPEANASSPSKSSD